MKFKSDSQRKAVFANMFNNGYKSRSRVSPINVTNFETKSTRMKQTKLPKFKVEPVRLKDIKTKSGKISCSMCKRKGLLLKKGACKDCTEERRSYVDPNKHVFDVVEDYYWEHADDSVGKTKDEFKKFFNNREKANEHFGSVEDTYVVIKVNSRIGVMEIQNLDGLQYAIFEPGGEKLKGIKKDDIIMNVGLHGIKFVREAYDEEGWAKDIEFSNVERINR